MAFDQTIVFGSGMQKGAGVTGFHRQGNQGVFTGLLFRGDSRGPDIVFNFGFTAQAAGITIAGRVTSAIPGVETHNGTTRGVVSTSCALSMGIYWAVYNAAESWVYAIYIENEPWAASAVTNLMGQQGQAAAQVQQEIMLMSIPPHRIYGARKVRRGIHGGAHTLDGDKLLFNRNYKGTALSSVPGMTNDPQYQAFNADVRAVTGV